MDLFEQVVLAGKALEDKKAVDITVIDVSKTSTITSYVVIATATSNTHAKALLDNVYEKMQEQGIEAYHKEGYGQSEWVVLDFGDFIVHIFTQELREYYNLEKLYQDGKNMRKFESILKDLLAKQKKQEKLEQKQTKKIAKTQSKKEKPEEKKTSSTSKEKKAKTSSKTSKKTTTKAKTKKAE